LQRVIALSGDDIAIYGTCEGVVMPDVTFLPSAAGEAGMESTSQTLSVEIKPKFGGLPTCDTISSRDRPLKHRNSRYMLHQLYKTSQGKISEPSNYSPLDLFSGESSRMEAALHALFEHPQNNLALFLNGKRLLSDRHTTWCELVAAGVFSTEGGSSANVSGPCEKDLVAVLRSILGQEEVLRRLLRAQMMCPYDIDGVHFLHLLLLHGQSSKALTREEEDHDTCGQRTEALARLASLPRDEALAVLRS
jgi:inositol-pentakisphosphate 2-kinase